MTEHDPYREDLPLYAAGALPRDERARMELHLAECSECREELRALTEAAAQIAIAIESVAPPRQLREKLIAKIETEEALASVASRRSFAARPWRSIWFWAPACAAVVLAIAAGLLWSRAWSIQKWNQQLTAQLQTNEEAGRQARDLIRMLLASDAQRVTLLPAGERPRPQAKAVYSLRQHSLVLLASNLNSLPAHKIYELWLLPANGSKPIPAGTFKPDPNGSAAIVSPDFSSAVPAKGFAVTIEEEPGSATPTLPIVLSGGA